MGANHNTSTCNFCDKEVSLITTKLQKKESSERWRKFGKCCASCDSDIIIEFDDKIKDIVDSESWKKGSSAYIQDRRISNPGHTDYKTNPEETLKSKKIKSGKRLITSGRIIGTTGAFLFILLIYIEYAVFAFGGLIVLLAGILLCRVGVIKIARCRKLTPARPIKFRTRKPRINLSVEE